MKRLLFVDSETNTLEAIERMLFPMRKEWDMTFLGSGEDALARMAVEPVDILVTDLRLPGIDGVSLLKAVQEDFPGTVRFILTGQSEESAIFPSLGAAHQFIAKPCNANVLRECVDRAFALRDLMKNATLKHLMDRVDSIPAAPQAYTALLEELQREGASLSSVGRIIESDIGMSAKVLQLVNSAFFGLGKDISSVTQAVTLLGLDTVKALVLVVGVFSQADGKAMPAEFSVSRLWGHCAAAASYANAIATAEGLDKASVANTFTAGLLHDAGLLLLASNFPAVYEKVMEYAAENGKSLPEAELACLGVTHGELGAYLLGIWGLPDSILESIAFHLRPGDCPADSFGPLTAVHAANVLEHEAHGPWSELSAPVFDMAYIESLGLTGRLDAWREACQKIG